MSDLFDRRDASDLIRWLAGGVVVCSSLCYIFQSDAQLNTIKTDFSNNFVWWIPPIFVCVVVSGKLLAALSKYWAGKFIDNAITIASFDSIRFSVKFSNSALLRIWRCRVAKFILWFQISTRARHSAVYFKLDYLSVLSGRVDLDLASSMNIIDQFICLAHAIIEPSSGTLYSEINRSIDRLVLGLEVSYLCSILSVVHASMSLLSVVGFGNLAPHASFWSALHFGILSFFARLMIRPSFTETLILANIAVSSWRQKQLSADKKESPLA